MLTHLLARGQCLSSRACSCCSLLTPVVFEACRPAGHLLGITLLYNTREQTALRPLRSFLISSDGPPAGKVTGPFLCMEKMVRSSGELGSQVALGLSDSGLLACCLGQQGMGFLEELSAGNS